MFSRKLLVGLATLGLATCGLAEPVLADCQNVCATVCQGGVCAWRCDWTCTPAPVCSRVCEWHYGVFGNYVYACRTDCR